MEVSELFVLSMALGMDAFAVAVCKGLSMPKMSWKKAIVIGGYFGSFQALMPYAGYFLGIGFEEKIKSMDHWIAWGLLCFLGIKMIIGAIKEQEENIDDSISFKSMVILAIATSIDALAVGVTFAFLRVNILQAIIAIGVITFFLCIWGVKIGNVFGDKYKKKAEIAGGIILIAMGAKILIEHCLIN